MPKPILSSLILPVQDETTGEVTNIEYDLPASGSSITIDDEISSSSEHPVQNKVIAAALDDKADTSSLGTAATRDVPTSGNANVTQVVIGSDTRLTNARNAADVYDWAKAETKPTYTADEVGAIASTLKGANNGVAELDANGLVPSSQLPSYVDDVLEYSSQSAFPATGETGKIYVATDTNLTYRWSGSAYVEISESLALGETSSTAYRGDRGKTAYDHSQLTSGNPHNVTKSDVGLGNVGNFKAVSTEASQGLSDTEKSNARANIGAGTSSLSLGTSSSTAYRGDYGNSAYAHAVTNKGSAFSSGLYKITTNSEGHVTAATAVAKADITGLGIPASDTNNRRGFYGTCSTEAATAAKVVTLSDTTGWELKAGTIVAVKFTNTNTASSVTLNVNSSGAKSIYYNNAAYTGSSADICGYASRIYIYVYDGTYWVWVSHGVDNNTTYSVVSTSANGLAPKVTDTSKFLKGDGTWATPTNTTYNFAGTTFNSGNSSTAEHNANNAVKNGNYYYTSNGPATSLGASTDDGALYVQSYSDTWVAQIAQDYRNGNIFVRGKNNGTWQAWKKPDAGTVSGYTVAKSVPSNAVFTDTNNRRGFYGTCATAAATAEKAVTLGSTAGWELVAGTIVGVKFTNTNTAGTAKLNVNSSGAKQIWYNGAAYTGTEARITGWAGHVIYYMYDGTYWCFLNNDQNYINTNTTYSAGTGLSLSSTTFSLATSGATAGSYGPSANVDGTNGTTMSVPYITVDTYGRVTSISNKTYTSRNTDTNNAVTQTATTTSADYEVLFSVTADNTTRTEGARKNSNLKFNPSTGNLQATKLNGVTIGSSPVFTDTRDFKLGTTRSGASNNTLYFVYTT